MPTNLQLNCWHVIIKEDMRKQCVPWQKHRKYGIIVEWLSSFQRSSCRQAFEDIIQDRARAWKASLLHRPDDIHAAPSSLTFGTVITWSWRWCTLVQYQELIQHIISVQTVKWTSIRQNKLYTVYIYHIVLNPRVSHLILSYEGTAILGGDISGAITHWLVIELWHYAMMVLFLLQVYSFMIIHRAIYAFFCHYFSIYLKCFHYGEEEEVGFDNGTAWLVRWYNNIRYTCLEETPQVSRLTFSESMASFITPPLLLHVA